MRNGRRGMSSRWGWIWGVLGVLVLANLVLDVMHYQNYQSKMDILAEALCEEWSSGGEEDNLEVVAGLLRDGQDARIERGRELLEEYGYIKTGRNRFQAELARQCAVTTAVCLGVFCLFFVIMIRKGMREQRKQERFLSAMEQSLVRLREEKRELLLLPEEWAWEEDLEVVGRLNHQLEALRDQLAMEMERATQEKEGVKGLVTDLSHQLKTPVAALDACLSIVEDSSLSVQEREEFVGRCRDELDGLEQLLQSLLQISRMEAGMIQICPKKVSVLAVLTAAVNRIYPRASEKEIEITVDYPQELEGICAMLDEKWFCEAVINLLDNGVKYSPAGTEIAISLQRRSGLLRIEIRDQGIGIPKEEYHKVFQRFYRGADNRVKKESGSGVGLYLVREIVQRHYGTVTVMCPHGWQGTVFVLQLPI